MLTTYAIRKFKRFTPSPALLGVAMTLAIALAPALSQASSTSASSIVGVFDEFYIYTLDGQYSNGLPVTATANQSFTGLDRNNQAQTMNFSGSTTSSAEFGRLHVKTEASVANSYYNAANPHYTDFDGNNVDPNGSPRYLTSLGFAVFDDTLQFGGSLQSGYKARFIFRYDGTNSGIGALADLAVDVDGANVGSFFATDTGFNAGTWATGAIDVKGNSAQLLHVQFSNQVVLDTFELTDGGTYWGQSDFSSTATLDHIEIVDANGIRVSGVTVTSGSGTQYSVNPVPEPATTSLVIGLVSLYRKRRASRS